MDSTVVVVTRAHQSLLRASMVYILLQGEFMFVMKGFKLMEKTQADLWATTGMCGGCDVIYGD